MIYHRNLKYAGQILDWLDTDSREQWDFHLTNKNNELKKSGWLDQIPIQYKFNSAGFRGDDFNLNIKIVAAGCSHTFGVGLHEHQTWVGQLEQLLDCKIQNLGVSGASMDTVYRILDSLLDHLRPDVLFLFAPPSYRVEFCIDDNSIWEVYNIHTNNNEHLKNYFINDINSAYNFQKNLQAIQYICLEKNIRLIHLSADHDFVADHSARDLLHSGPDVHKGIAERFYKMFNQRL